MEFLYFVPGLATPIANREQAAERGLGYVFDDDVNPSWNMLTIGPSGERGCLCARSDRVVYAPDQQTWRPIYQHPDRAWVGLWNHDRPTPGSLARGEQLAGEQLELDDGSRWNVPIALRWTEQGFVSTLPRLMTRDVATGKWVSGDVRLKYRHLWNFLEEYWRDAAAASAIARAAGERTYVLPDSHDRLAFAALTANYRVLESELDLLGVIDTGFPKRVVAIVTNEREFESIQKKTASVNPKISSTSPGRDQSTQVGTTDGQPHGPTP